MRFIHLPLADRCSLQQKNVHPQVTATAAHSEFMIEVLHARCAIRLYHRFHKGEKIQGQGIFCRRAWREEVIMMKMSGHDENVRSWHAGNRMN